MNDRHLLEEKIRTHPGREISRRFKQLEASIYIFNVNYIQLKAFIDNYKKEENLKIYSTSEKEAFLKYLFEITRLIHNYVASVLSLIDHTRVYFNNYYKLNGLFPDYQMMVNERFIDSPLANFMKGFRQYCQHYKIPNIYVVLNLDFKTEKAESILKINKKSLLDFDGWNSRSKEYILSFNDDIILEQVVEDYNKLIKDFYNWFRTREMELHKDTINDYEMICQEFNTLASKD